MVVNAPIELTDEMFALLKKGANHRYGQMCTTQTEQQKAWPMIKQLIQAGLAYESAGWAYITDEAGRDAVGGPTLSELHQKAWAALCGGRAC